MLDLLKLERILILLLLSSLLIGAGIMIFQKSERYTGPRIESFVVNGKALPGAIGEKKAKININEAGVEELMRLDGVGRVLAERIVAYRSSKGRFYSKSEIKNVKGIGEALFERIRDDISFE